MIEQFLHPILTERLSEPLTVVDHQELNEEITLQLLNPTSPMDIISIVMKYVEGIELIDGNVLISADHLTKFNPLTDYTDKDDSIDKEYLKNLQGEQ